MSDTPACHHNRTRLIAKDKDAEYVECLDCGALLEAAELLKSPPGDAAAISKKPDDPPTDESLSEA